MAKRQPPSFTVLADSNALFPKDVTKLVSPRFMAIWQECSALATLRLILPEVVKGERLYQLVTIAEKATQNAVKNFDTIAKVTGKDTPTLPTREGLIAAVEKRFTDWASENAINVVPTPIDKIDWKRIINDSVWRVPPFTPAGEEEDSEKGFRDCLILETLRDIVQSGPGIQFVFISNDGVLRDTAVRQFDRKVLTAYEDISSFASYLKLTNEKIAQEFAQAVVQKISSVFYTENDPECVFYKCNIDQAITEQFGFILNQFAEKSDTPLSDLIAKPTTFAKTPTGIFEAASDEKKFIDSTEFDTLTAPNVYHWKTHLRFVRLFRQTNASLFLQSLGFDEKIRIATFAVSWKATVDEDETFSNIAVTDTNLTEESTEDGCFNKVKYGLESRRPYSSGS